MPDRSMTQMKIEEWPIDRPIPYARNAREIPQSAIDKVAASIHEFGWRQPIVVDEHGVIIAGHTRLLARSRPRAIGWPRACSRAMSFCNPDGRRLRAMGSRVKCLQ